MNLFYFVFESFSLLLQFLSHGFTLTIFFNPVLQLPFKVLHLPLQIVILLLQQGDQLRRLLYRLLHNMALACFSCSHRLLYQIIYQTHHMSFEFTSKVQTLTNKLQTLNQTPKPSIIQDIKQQLIALKGYMSKQLIQAEKRIKRIEDKFEKRASAARRQQKSIQLVWNQRQQKVSEVISGWVQQYEVKAQQTLSDLEREQQIIHTRLQEQHDSLHKQANLIEDRIADQMRTLQREISNYNKMTQEHHLNLTKQLGNSKQYLLQFNAQNRQFRDQTVRQIQIKINNLREHLRVKCDEQMTQIKTRNSKTKHVFQLLMQLQ